MASIPTIRQDIIPSQDIIRVDSTPGEQNGAMSMVTGLAIGFAAGYYLGSKAGRERYHQIEDVLETVRRSEGYRQLRDRVADVLETGVERVEADIRDADITLDDYSPSR